MMGNRANPTPPSVHMLGLNCGSVGKSRQTDYERKLLDGLAEKLHRQAREQDEVAAARRDQLRAREAEAGHDDSEDDSPDPLYGQSFSGKGVAAECAGKPESHIFILDEVMSMLTQVGLASENAKQLSEGQLEEQSFVATLWSTGRYMKHLADGPRYKIRFAACGLHAMGHVNYMAKVYEGTQGKDATGSPCS